MPEETMHERDSSQATDVRPCPGCGGRGFYELTPVGDVLCPACEGSGRTPSPTKEAAGE